METSARRKRSTEDRLVLDEHERVVLAGADREVFLEAMLDPPDPAEKLVIALRRHRMLLE